MNKKRNIILVGPMGAGKSSVGKRLAQVLDLPFMDTDHEIEARLKVSISTIFDVEGEAGFRQREAQVIADLVEHGSRKVLATGGGAVILPENRQELSAFGTVVYLSSSVKQLVERTRHDTARPLLQQGDPEKVLTTLMKEREPFYREVADIVLHTERKSINRVVQEILNALAMRGWPEAKGVRI
ncbi:MAG: shikimate kinase AroK [Gammaproteobacteria bacterium]|nr:shikimate kinase AroK [Gammaproteobacteria bacterium]